MIMKDEMDQMELFELTPKQQKAFDNLKSAFKKCEGLNMLFYNNYGVFGAADLDKISEYNDEEDNASIYDNNQLNSNEFRLPCNEWADDSHYFHPTNKLKQ